MLVLLNNDTTSEVNERILEIVNTMENEGFTFDQFIMEHINASNELVKALQEEPDIETKIFDIKHKDKISVHELGEALKSAKLR